MLVPAFRWYWASQLASGVGTWAQAVAQSWLVLELTHSAVVLGTVTMLQFLPLMIFPLLGGVIADRLPRRRMLIATQGAAHGPGPASGALVATGTVQLWEVAVLALLLGLTNAFNNPAAQAFVPELVGTDLVADAVAINSIQFNLARMVGGAVGGITVAWWGIAGALFLNAASYVPAIAVLAMIRPAHVTVRRAGATSGSCGELAEGLRYAVEHAVRCGRVVALFGVVGLLGFNWQVALAAARGGAARRGDRLRHAHVGAGRGLADRRRGPGPQPAAQRAPPGPGRSRAGRPPRAARRLVLVRRSPSRSWWPPGSRALSRRSPPIRSCSCRRPTRFGGGS